MGRDGSTLDATLRLFRKGVTPDEIAKRRMLAVSTVYGHLEHFVKEGKIDVFKLIDKPTFKIIKSAIDKVGTWGLSNIKENCPDDINYTEIRLVVAHIEHKRGKKNSNRSATTEGSPTGNRVVKGWITPFAKELYENIYVRNYKTLSPAVKSILSDNFKSCFDLLPWVRNRSKDFKAYTGGDRFLERELSTFITTLRTELNENGYDYDLQKQNSSRAAKIPKITSITAEEAHQKVRELRPANAEAIEKRLQEPKYPLYDSDYLKEQYHNLICAYPPRARKILIEHIPTVEDYYRKVLLRGVEFSSRLEDKAALDTFLNIFKQIYDDYYNQKLNALTLFTRQMHMKPYNNLTSDETVKLDKAEHPEKYKEEIKFKAWDWGLFPELPKPRCQHVNSGDLWFCHQIDEPVIDFYYDPDTAYEDLIVLAITVVQAAKLITKSLHALTYEFYYFDKAEIVSFSLEKMEVWLGEKEKIKKKKLYRGETHVFCYYDEYEGKKSYLNKTVGYYDKLVYLEKDFQKWLYELRKYVGTLSRDRLLIYSDFYKIKVFDKLCGTSCSIYTFINWIEKNSIEKVATEFFVAENSNGVNRRNFPGKFHF